ncbi:hypothetical protein FB451DRAFT_1548888 [Mycena latifolia]|nr:hypothetical protein FB451DRAFT_1548888 [Mycena latifolia]
MPVGEVPITSYFTRVPQKKRKENPHKRKRLHDDEEYDVTTRPLKKEPRIQGSLTFPKGSRKTVSALSRRPGTPSSSDVLAGPLHTPVAGKRLRVASPSPAPKAHVPLALVSDEPTPAHLRQSSSSSAPSPSPIRITPASQARIAKGNDVKGKSVAFGMLPSASGFHEAINVPNNPHAVARNDEPPDEDDAPSSFIVPSSQSQYISSTDLPLQGRFNLHTPASQSDASQLIDHVSSSQSQYMLSPSRGNGRPNVDFVPSSQSQYITGTLAPIYRDDDGFVVPSSQSQWLLPVHGKEDDCNPPDGLADDEIIPSSQSQFELELIPRPTSREPTHVSFPGQSIGPSVRSHLDVDVEDMFDNAVVTGSASCVDEDDSETESDDDVPSRPRSLEAIRPPSPEHEEYSLQSGFSGGSVQSLPADECGSAASFRSSVGSLPSAVKDFYDMFGSGDASYPDDFPESLKWSGGDTQD